MHTLTGNKSNGLRVFHWNLGSSFLENKQDEIESSSYSVEPKQV